MLFPHGFRPELTLALVQGRPSAPCARKNIGIDSGSADLPEVGRRAGGGSGTARDVLAEAPPITVVLVPRPTIQPLRAAFRWPPFRIVDTSRRLLDGGGH